ncbi:hypothetical protein ILYODFUR_014089, partial [Ilyodon furcidens]
MMNLQDMKETQYSGMTTWTATMIQQGWTELDGKPIKKWKEYLTTVNLPRSSTSTGSPGKESINSRGSKKAPEISGGGATQL